MNVTTATIKSAINKLGFDQSDFEIKRVYGTAEVESMNEEQIDAVVSLIVNVKQCECNGRKTGYGAWIYRFERQSELSKLVSANID